MEEKHTFEPIEEQPAREGLEKAAEEAAAAETAEEATEEATEEVAEAAAEEAASQAGLEEAAAKAAAEAEALAREEALDRQLDELYGGVEDEEPLEVDAAAVAAARPPRRRLDQMDLEEEPPRPRKKKKKKKKGKKKARQRRRRILLTGVFAVLLVLLLIGVFYVYRILKRPQDLFTESVANVTAAPTAERMEPAFDLSAYGTAAPEATPEPILTAPPQQTEVPAATPTEAPTPEPTEEPQAPDNIVNILLMGLDAFENGGTTSGQQPHTDVMMVVAVNFDKDVVDMITLPRDIFTTAPGLHGFYKLNGVFNAGGGMDDPESGFALTCRAAEFWLGGISIPYYYAVDFQTVVSIVDTLGGIDYDVDQPFTAYRVEGNTMSASGKHYGKGMQHLDGNAVLQYLRVRHEADGLDSSRTARQRRMLVAIYNKLKTEGKLTQVPQLINAATSGVYTNTTLTQTTALANYAMTKIEADQIHTRSVTGDIWYQHYFKYVFVDQDNRLRIIKEVYGIDAEPVGVNTPQYENWLYSIGFEAMKYLRQPEKIFKAIQAQKDQGKTFTEEQMAVYAACYQAYAALDEGFAACSERVQKAYVDPTRPESEVKAMEKEVKAQLQALNENVKKTTLALQKAFDTHVKLEWKVSTRWFADTDINEVLVYFG